jgi:hypothetical protein
MWKLKGFIGSYLYFDAFYCFNNLSEDILFSTRSINVYRIEPKFKVGQKYQFKDTRKDPG